MSGFAFQKADPPVQRVTRQHVFWFSSGGAQVMQDVIGRFVQRQRLQLRLDHQALPQCRIVVAPLRLRTEASLHVLHKLACVGLPIAVQQQK